MTSRFPFTPYPNGWFLLAYSDELPVGAVQPLHYFGRELVLFRGEDGLAHLVDAYCPHLGAHLGHGGTVCGSNLRCPFHGWSFDGTGQCVAVPGVHKIPPKARVRSWPLSEHDGVIVVYHHSDNAPPDHEPMRVPYFNDPAWTTTQRFRWKVRTHPQEVVENVIDVGHFRWVHGWEENPVCKQFEPQGPFLQTLMEGKANLEGSDSVPMTLRMRSMGLGWMDVHIDVVFKYHIIDTYTPIDGEYIEMRSAVRVLKADLGDANYEELVPLDLDVSLRQDINILEHRRYRPSPMLCETDGPIMALRRWASQFYPPAAGPTSTPPTT